MQLFHLAFLLFHSSNVSSHACSLVRPKTELFNFGFESLKKYVSQKFLNHSVTVLLASVGKSVSHASIKHNKTVSRQTTQHGKDAFIDLAIVDTSSKFSLTARP